jgi:predicted ATPase
VLAFLKLSSSERFDAIEAALRSIVPSVRAIRIRKQKTLRDEYGKLKRERTVQEYVGDAIVFDTSSGSDLPASACSEGTMFVLGLLTVILGPQRPRLLLLDDIDHALHPRAQEKLSNEIRAFMSQCPDLQIVATSHSPLLLDHLTHDEVRITNINDDGTVTIGRLDEHAKFSRWKDEMTPGEFWSMVGEKWLSETSATSAGK